MTTRRAEDQLQASAKRVMTIPVKMYRPYNNEWSLRPTATPVVFELILTRGMRHEEEDSYKVDAVSVDYWPPDLMKRTKNTNFDLNANIDQVFKLLEEAFTQGFIQGRVIGFGQVLSFKDDDEKKQQKAIEYHIKQQGRIKQHIRDAIKWV